MDAESCENINGHTLKIQQAAVGSNLKPFDGT